MVLELIVILSVCMSQQILPLLLAALSLINETRIVTRRPFEELINIAHQIRAIVVAVRVFLFVIWWLVVILVSKTESRHYLSH
jgi:hypothetical protein